MLGNNACLINIDTNDLKDYHTQDNIPYGSVLKKINIQLLNKRFQKT